MSYLERWWRDASFSRKEDFIKLVKNGQLEIVGGGWVMNDEVMISSLQCIPYFSYFNIAKDLNARFLT